MKNIQRDIYNDINIKTDKKIAIWGYVRESLLLFNECINARLKCDFFVCEDNRLLRETFCGATIISPVEAINFDVCVLYVYQLDSETKKWIREHFSEFYEIKLGEIKKRIIEAENLYIYGAGSAGIRTYRVLRERGVDIDGFIDSDESKRGTIIESKKVYGVDILEANDSVILSLGKYQDVINGLIALSIEDDHIFIDLRNSGFFQEYPIQYNDMVGIWLELIGRSIPLYLSLFLGWWDHCINDFCGKTVFLYGDNELKNQYFEIFDLLGIQTYSLELRSAKKSVSSTERCINDYFRIPSDKRMILVLELKKGEVSVSSDVSKIFDTIGLEYFKDYRFYNASYSNSIYNRISDAMLGFTYTYTITSEEYPGFVVLGNPNDSKKKIAILGGSTSDVGFLNNIEISWPEHIHSLLGDNVSLFCGGICGYDVAHEFMKLIRDVMIIKPDIVISYSGVNNTRKWHNDYNRFNKYLAGSCRGLRDTRSFGEHWIAVQRYMKSICAEENITYIGIFQPNILTKKHLSPKECLIYPVSGVEEYESFFYEMHETVKEFAKCNDWMHDLTGVFDDIRETIYLDRCHVNSCGNQIVANAIYDIVNKEI